MIVLLLNAGSSSLKGAVMETADRTVIARALADWAGVETRYKYAGPDGREHNKIVDWKGHAEAVKHFMDDLTHSVPVALPDRSALAAVGHRVVHGGPFTSSVEITASVRSRIAALADLAPLHNPPSLETLAVAEAELHSLPHVAVFDTAFHATLPLAASTYPVPASWASDWKIRRYGFHGLSLAHCTRRAAEMLGTSPSDLRLIICHLGHGCSATAVKGGDSVDTTMGFTPLDGLMMGTRSGSIDPGILLHVQQQRGLTAEQVNRALYRESGLLGVSGISADMRDVLAAAQRGNERAQLALAVYAHRVRQAIGAMAVSMSGVDALVFTGGVGEHASEVRQTICAGLECLGLELDRKANASCRPDSEIATVASPGRILVITAREDLTMLHEVDQVLATRQSAS